MAKQLIFTYNEKEYTLEFTRRTVTEMEKKGFIAAEVENKPMSTLPALFEGAFLAHHRFEKKDVIDKIFASMTKKEELIGKLAEMYNEPIMALIEEPEEKEGNVDWAASW
jgi:macrodomain Ter protein organizer (MatP/YcbG family)